MLTLFGNLDSGNVHKVQMILHSAGKRYRRVDVAQTRNEPRDERFLAVNPMGKVPAVMCDDGRVITESGAILYYFSQGTPLWPEGVDARTECLRWMFFEQYSHEPALAVMRYLRHFTDDPGRHTNRIAELEPRARHALGVMEARLKSSKWLAGEACTIADYALYPYTRAAGSVGFEIEDFPGTGRWLARLEARPDFIAFGDEGAAKVQSFDEFFRVQSP